MVLLVQAFGHVTKAAKNNLAVKVTVLARYISILLGKLRLTVVVPTSIGNTVAYLKHVSYYSPQACVQ